MSNTLIVNLKRFGDIFSSGHLVNSLKKDDPSKKVSIIIFEEFEAGTKALNLFDNIYTINREDILTLKGNDLFPDSMAINLFTRFVDMLKGKDFKEIINYSNDEVSTNIVSFLNFNKNSNVVGVHYDRKKNVLFNSDWSIIFNDVLTTFPISPIHFIDCYHKMCGLSSINTNKVLVSNKKYDDIAKNNFQQIIKIKFKDLKDIKIIGIQLKTSSPEKDIPKKIIIKLIERLKKHGKILPVILISSSPNEKEYANEINEVFKNSLISIESDFLALPSVMNNLDLLISPDTSVKHIADLNKTPVLEVINGPAPFLKQGTFNKDNCILTHKSNLTPKIKKFESFCPSSEDIYHSALFQIGLIQKEKIKLSPKVLFFKVEKDSLGTRYDITNKEVDNETQKLLLSLYISRYYIQSITESNTPNINIKTFSHFKIDLINEWAKEEKDQAFKAIKDLLETLKALISIQKNINNGKDFANSLDKIFNYCSSDFLISIPTLIFRAKIENLIDNSFDNNMKSVEGLLYEFKRNIQTLINKIDDFNNLVNKIPNRKKPNIQKPVFL